MTPSRDRVRAALSGVVDPELDRPITDLGFVASIRVTPSVRVELRLPTYFCAPNFAWLMVADARDAVTALPGAGAAEVVLLDHFASDEINAGVAGGVDPDLAGLRATFDRKAHLAAQERLARAVAPADPALTLADAARLAPAAASSVARCRSRLGIDSPYAFCDDAGAPLAASALAGWLRFARTVRVSMDGNALLCRGLLETRYGPAQSR